MSMSATKRSASSFLNSISARWQVLFLLIAYARFDSMPDVTPCRVVSQCAQVLCEVAKERIGAAEKAGVAAIVSAGL